MQKKFETFNRATLKVQIIVTFRAKKIIEDLLALNDCKIFIQDQKWATYTITYNKFEAFNYLWEKQQFFDQKKFLKNEREFQPAQQ